MPYIDKTRREALADEDQSGNLKLTPGDLNYQITLLVSAYVRMHNLNYQTINDIVGALEGAKQEFYRRVAVPYENTKISINGDVYNY